MNKTVATLVVAVILLVGAVMYLIGQRNAAPGRNGAGIPEVIETAPAKATPSDAKADAASKTPTPASLKRAVRIGNDGPHESACRGIGSVANLPGGNDNFLAVRDGPSAKARQLDKLGADAPVFLCDQNGDGSWIGIVYQANGYVPVTDECRVEDSVPSRRPYSGPCLSGWVSAKYVEVRTQG